MFHFHKGPLAQVVGALGCGTAGLSEQLGSWPFANAVMAQSGCTLVPCLDFAIHYSPQGIFKATVFTSRRQDFAPRRFVALVLLLVVSFSAPLGKGIVGILCSGAFWSILSCLTPLESLARD